MAPNLLPVLIMVNRKTSSTFTLLLPLVIIALAGCGGDNRGHQPIPTSGPAQVGGSTASSSGATVQYSSIRPILEARCLACHSSGELNWNDPAKLAAKAADGTLARVISTGFMPLKGSPQAAAITDAEKQKLLAYARGSRSGGGVAAMSATSPKAVDISPASSGFNDPQLAVAFRCMACHGPNGIGTSEAFPNLANHGVDYIPTRLSQFLQKDYSGVMAQQLPQILKDNGFEYSVNAKGEPVIPRQTQLLFNYLGRFFGLYTVSVDPTNLTKVRNQFTADQINAYSLGQNLVAERCVLCHLTQNLRPIEAFPNIFTQHKDYLKERFAYFASGKGNPAMVAQVQSLSPEQIEALTLYLSTTLPTDTALLPVKKIPSSK